MRKALVLTFGVAVLASISSAQDDAAYKMWMQSIPPTVAAIRMAADNAAAAPDATKLADTFDKVEAYWKAKNVGDAATLAATARDAAKAIAAGTGDKAANLMMIQGTCGACHKDHRAGTAPNFTIK
jgi:mono/diheme cytochrome c family protein